MSDQRVLICDRCLRKVPRDGCAITLPGWVRVDLHVADPQVVEPPYAIASGIIDLCPECRAIVSDLMAILDGEGDGDARHHQAQAPQRGVRQMRQASHRPLLRGVQLPQRPRDPGGRWMVGGIQGIRSQWMQEIRLRLQRMHGGGPMPGKISVPKVEAPASAKKAKSARKVWTADVARSILVDKAAAKRTATARQTRLLKRDLGIAPSANARQRGEALHEGIMAMADTVAVTGLDEERYRKLQAMDDANLDAMYQSNELIFDVYFNYEGIREEGGAHVIDAEKLKDVDYLIEQYERMFGALR